MRVPPVMQPVSTIRSGARRDPTIGLLLVFATTATLLQYGAPRWLSETVLPYTGWVGLAVPYSFLLYFAAASLGTSDHKARLRMRRACFAILAVGVLTGVADWATLGGRLSDNPYLRVSPWRPLWTVLVPLLWITVLHWTKPPGEEQQADT